MNALRRVASVLLAAISLFTFAQHAIAASYSQDQSDLWMAAPAFSEGGWGIQFVQRGDVIFATMFVYGPDGTPTWYTATMVPTAPGNLAWSGDLIATTGPWFGTVPFNPATVTRANVGTMTWTPTTIGTGTLSYTVNGVAVVKNLIREILVNENYSGHFGGGIHQVNTNCAVTANNGTFEQAGIVDIAQSGTTVTITTSSAGGSCAYAGSLTQFGQMGQVNGNFTCSDGSFGSFVAFEMQVTEFSVTGRFNATYTNPVGCQASGWFGGLTVTTF